MNSFNMFRQVAAAGAFSFLFAFSPAHAAPTINAQIVPDAPSGTLANVPFTLVDLGSGGATNAAGRVTGVTSPFTLNDVTYTFTGASGVYRGDVSGSTRSPLRNADGTASAAHYLNARANSGSVVMSFAVAQTAFNMLWGSIDFLGNPTTYNRLTFTFGGMGGSEAVAGIDVRNALVTPPNPVNGQSNVAVSITGLSLFNTLTVTATNEAFEFLPGVPVAVPAPAALALFGAGLLGLYMVRRRRVQG